MKDPDSEGKLAFRATLLIRGMILAADFDKSVPGGCRNLTLSFTIGKEDI